MHYKVFIDTNIFISSGYSFHNGAFNRLREYASAGVLELQINSVVYHEVRKHIKENVGQSVKQLNKALKAYSFSGFRMQEQFKEKLDKVDEEEWIDYVLSEFDALLKDLNVDKLCADRIDGEKIVSAYFNVEPPFDQKKEKVDEFPDAITIQTIANEINRFSDEERRFFKGYPVAGKEDALIYCIVSNDEAFRKAFETIIDNRIDNQDILLFDSVNSLLQKLLENKTVEKLLTRLEAGFYRDEIKSKIHDYLMSSAYIIDGENGISDESSCVDTKDMNCFPYISEIEVNETGNIQAKIDYDVYTKVRIEYSFLNENESYWDKEDSAYLWTVHTDEDAWYEIEREIVVSVQISTDNNIDGNDWKVTNIIVDNQPEDIYVHSYNLVEIISSENRG